MGYLFQDEDMEGSSYESPCGGSMGGDDDSNKDKVVVVEKEDTKM